MDYLRCGIIMDLKNKWRFARLESGRAPEIITGSSPDLRAVTILWFELDCHDKTIEISNMLIEELYAGRYR